MRVLYIGNFVENSTESHVAEALTRLGHDVRHCQENKIRNWQYLASGHVLEGVDVLLWTRTGWDWENHYHVGVPEMHAMQRAALENATHRNIPTVGYHLDLWHGLQRAHEIRTEPFFQVDLLVTADGGHEDEWRAAGVNHLWMPPAVSASECVPGRYNPAFAADIAFVGSWSSYHAEAQHRFDLVTVLRRTFGGQARFFPDLGQPSIRGEQLRDLYATTCVNVGDSCLIGNARRYWSDRIPECLGRGGFLLHPWVEGLDEHFTVGTHLAVWPLWDWKQLEWSIRYYLDHADERRTIAAAGKAHVLAHHTYGHRMQTLLDLVAP